ncbi:MAG TPA: ERF family protein [Phormidium sp.]
MINTNNADITTSESVVNIIPALIKAWKSFKPILKTKKNPAFQNNKYAPHDSVNDAIMPALLENNLIVLQPVQSIEGEHYVVTTVFHESGEFISSKYPLPSEFVIEHKDQRKERIINDQGREQDILVKFTAERDVVKAQSEPQKFGMSITYARRYALQALFNVCADEDDDGNVASGNTNNINTYAPAKNGANKPQAKKTQTTQPQHSQAQQRSTNRNGNTNGNGAHQSSLTLVDCYIQIATLCNVMASERDPKMEQVIEADPNNFSIEAEKMAATWKNKHEPIEDEDAFSSMFWHYMTNALQNNNTPERFLKAFKDWQSQTLQEINNSYRDETGSLVEYPTF